MLRKPSDNAGPVRYIAVLAQLPFADQSVHVDFDSDDRLEHAFEKIGWRITRRPWRCKRRLVARCQARNQRLQPASVVDRAHATAGLHHGVVPGRHHLAVHMLARIPTGAHIALRALKHNQHLRRHSRRREGLRERIRARDVGTQHAGVRSAGRELERQQVCDDVLGIVFAVARNQLICDQLICDQQAQRKRIDELRKQHWVAFRKGLWQIHGGVLSLATGRVRHKVFESGAFRTAGACDCRLP